MDMPIYRINGGIGFAVDGLNLKVSATQARVFSIADYREKPLSKDQKENLVRKLENAKKKYKLSAKATITIESGPPSHSGFGFGTAMALSAIEAYLALNNVSYGKNDIIQLSERGGTSGIGIHTYFHGGLVLDTGNSTPHSKHLPSSIAQAPPPKVASSHVMPNWDIGIFLPAKGLCLHGNDEIDFFNKTCPIAHEEASESIYHAILGTLFSVAEENLSTFSFSINNIQNTKWKSEEIQRQGKRYRKLMEELRHHCLAVGMSSLGPALLIVCDDYEKTRSAISENRIQGQLLKVRPNNIGRVVLNA